MARLINALKIMKSIEGTKKNSKELSLELNISERMIRKYIDDIRKAGIEIISTPGPQGGYEINGENSKG